MALAGAFDIGVNISSPYDPDMALHKLAPEDPAGFILFGTMRWAPWLVNPLARQVLVC